MQKLKSEYKPKNVDLKEILRSLDADENTYRYSIIGGMFTKASIEDGCFFVIHRKSYEENLYSVSCVDFAFIVANRYLNDESAPSLIEYFNTRKDYELYLFKDMFEYMEWVLKNK
jgi:hypothetical protein